MDQSSINIALVPRTNGWASRLYALGAILVLAAGAQVASAQTTITVQVASGPNDRYIYTNSGAGSDTLAATYAGTWNDQQLLSVMRFEGVNIPQGAIITSAYLIISDPSVTASTIQTGIRAHNADNSTIPSAGSDVVLLPKTTANVAWTMTASSTTSSDIKTVIQEVVDRSGWNLGNALTVMLQGSEAPSTGTFASFSTYEAGASVAPKLEVTYTTAGGSKTVLLVTQNATIGSEESSRKAQFEAWGYNVTTIDDSATQSAYNTAVASADVVYIPYTAGSVEIMYKLRSVEIGVVWEAVSSLDHLFGLAPGGSSGVVNTSVDLVNTTHAITSGLSDPLTIYSSSKYQRPIVSPVSSSTILGVADYTSSATLAVLEPGAALNDTVNGNSTAAGRRARLPFGGGTFTWADITSGGKLLIARSLEWASTTSSNKSLLLVIAGSSPTSEESLRVTQFQSWGYTVNTIEDSSTQTTYDTAVALADVVYIPNSVSESDVSTKLRLAAGGIVSEFESLDNEIGFGTSNGGWSNGSTIEVFNNTHPVTQGFSTGTVTILGNNARRSFVQGTPAPAGVGLAYLFTTSAPDLMAIEEGGQLANTQVSNTYAAGRRVRLPLANGTFDWADLNSNGLTLIRQALQWASEHAGLKGHWKLDETSGTTAVDSSDSEKNGTYTNGATPGFTGVRGYAADFDGTDDHITISGGTDYNLRENFTVACWAKSDTATFAGNGCLVSKRHAWVLHPAYNGTHLYFHVANSAGNQYSGDFDMDEVGGIQQWHHYVGVYNGTGGEIKLYIDGVLRKSSSFTVGSLATSNTGQMTIGKDSSYSSSDRHFDGQIDDVYLYDKALSDAEIAELYGLIGHWKFDETSGSVAADSSGIGSDMDLWNGVVVGATGPYPGDGDIAAEFDGIDDNASAPIADAHDNITEYVSVAVWVKFDTAIADQTDQNRILIRNDWDTQRGFALLADQPYGDRLLFRVLDGTTYAQASWENPDIEAGIWYHVVGTYDGFNVKLYVDGDLKVSTPFTSPIVPYNDDKIRFGYKLDGRMHDLRLYNRAITEAEIAEIYGLIAHWKLDETSGSIAADSSGMGHDAVLTGLEGWTTKGQVDGAFTFDYADGDDYFVAPATPTLNNLTDDSHSVMAWFKPRSVPPETGSHNNAYYAVLMKPGLHSGIAYEYSAYAFFSTWDSSSNQIGAASSTTLPSGKFYHLAAVLDRDNGVVSFYVDGVFQSSSTFTPGVTLKDYASVPWRIGIGSPGTSTWRWPAHATIDDAKLYNRPLGADEVLKIYESGHTKGIRIIRWTEAR